MTISTTTQATGRIVIAAITAIVALSLVAPPAVAEDIIATDPGPTTVAAATVPSAPRAAASIPRGIVVTHPGSQPVVLFAKGQPTQRRPRPGNAPATFTGLRAGVTYTVAVGGKVIGRVTAVDRPTAATRLVVSTTGKAGSVALAWQHTPTTATGGRSIAYEVAAVPRTGKPLTVDVTGKRTTTLAGLDTAALYTFTVTPRNSAGKGKPTTAAMRRSLADISGVVPTVPEEPTPAAPAVLPDARPATTPAPAPAAATAPAPAPAPAPGPAPAPATKTIYVCPDGFTEAGSVCQKTTPYTNDVMAYTYHAENVYGWGQTGWDYSYGHCTGTGNSGTWPNGDPYCQIPVYGNTVVGTQYVRDAAPAGYTDTGSNWTKRSTPPAGYLDDGTQWVLTVGKEARVVPA